MKYFNILLRIFNVVLIRMMKSSSIISTLSKPVLFYGALYQNRDRRPCTHIPRKKSRVFSTLFTWGNASDLSYLTIIPQIFHIEFTCIQSEIKTCLFTIKFT